MIQFHPHLNCGNSSVVEHNLAMVGVASSTLVSRSIFLLLFFISSVFSITIKESLSEELTNRFSDINITDIEVFAPKKLPSDIASYTLKGVQITSLSGAKGGAKAFFLKEQGSTEISFKFEINAQIPVLLASKDIKSGSRLDEENTKIALIDFAQYEQNMLSALAKNKIARHNLRANTPIKANNVNNKKDISKGDILTLNIQDGGVSIQTSAEAMQDGNIGEFIEVRTKSGKTRAKIISKNQALIE